MPTGQTKGRVLILDTQECWVSLAKSELSKQGYTVDAPNEIFVDELLGLRGDDTYWDIIIISTVGAVLADRPLEALDVWLAGSGTSPVIVVSPYPSPTEARDVLYAGAAVSYVKKPWQPEEFRALLEEALPLAKKRGARARSLRKGER